MKVVLVSDNHGDLKSIEKILCQEQVADYYLHCGDSSTRPEDISLFASVRGNNDYFNEFPKERIIEIAGHKALLIHGHRLIGFGSFDRLADYAKEKECDICFFGHIHCFVDQEVKGVRLINPGSTFYNRDYSDPCYAVVEIEGNDIKVTKKSI